MSNPAGWYPDPSKAPQERYWDGIQWTEQTQPFPAPVGPKATTDIRKKKRGTGLISSGLVLAVIGVLITIMAAGTSHVDAYGGSSASGPTFVDYLIIVAGLALAGIGFCVRLLAAAESR